MNAKKLLAAILAVGMMATVTACSTGETAKPSETAPAPSTDAAASTPAETPAPTEGGSVGFAISTLNNPFFVSMVDGAKSKAAELGVDLIVADAGNDAAKQTSDIEDLISKKVKVLIVNPVDSAAAKPVVDDAIAAGIKIIAVDRSVEDTTVNCFIGTDNVKAAETAGAYFIEQVGEGAKIAVLEGIPGASSAIDRLQGFMNAAEGKVEIVASQTANFDRAEGLTVTEDILQAHPDITGIFSMNDEMGLGAIEGVTAAGKVPGKDVLITGFDAGEDARTAVKDGTMLYTVEQKTVLMGETAVEMAQKYLKGEEVPANVPIDVEIIKP